MALKSTDLLVVQDPDDKQFYKTTLSSLNVGVSSVDTELPVKNTGTPSNPTIEIQTATITRPGSVVRLASPDDVVYTNLNPSTEAVVTADLLRATNKAIADGGGGVGALYGTLPIEIVVVTESEETDQTPAGTYIAIKEAAVDQAGAVFRLSTADDLDIELADPADEDKIAVNVAALRDVLTDITPCKMTAVDGGFYAWTGTEPPAPDDQCGIDEINGGVYFEGFG